MLESFKMPINISSCPKITDKGIKTLSNKIAGLTQIQNLTLVFKEYNLGLFKSSFPF